MSARMKIVSKMRVWYIVDIRVNIVCTHLPVSIDNTFHTLIYNKKYITFILNSFLIVYRNFIFVVHESIEFEEKGNKQTIIFNTTIHTPNQIVRYLTLSKES